jgi:tetratricopeptide (TPR) repeat protein
MNTGPYSSKEVQKYIEERFIPVKSECFWDRRTDLMNRFAVKWTPTLLILDTEGEEHHRVVGYVPDDDLLAHLELGLGKIAYDQDRYAEAGVHFQAVIDRYPDAGAAPEAVFLLGVAGYRSTHDPKPLRRAYETLSERYPQSEWQRRSRPYAQIPL